MTNDGVWPQALRRIVWEPPFRMFWRLLLGFLPTSIRTKAQWEIGPYPAYLIGVLAAADQAHEDKLSEISVVEFGVSGGNGLLALQHWAALVEAETRIKIAVYGFDTGSGLPDLCGDFRDHPDHWMVGDYPIEVEALRGKFSSRTKLILGNVRETVQAFATNPDTPPVGFVAFDLDLYSSTRDALMLFSRPDRPILKRTYLYFDDVAFRINHRFAGELLAIREFNETNHGVKIDVWRGLRPNRVFPEKPWIDGMYIAHDLVAISRTTTERERKDYLDIR